MCTLVFYRSVLGEGTIGLAANRDENPNRPWTAPAIEPVEGVPALYPKDHRGGTWLGTNGTLVAALTNMAPPGGTGVRSRGLLVRDVLAAASFEEACGRVGELVRRDAYDGFNLLLAAPGAGPGGAAVLTWDGSSRLCEEPLGPGVHVLKHRVYGPVEAAGPELDPSEGATGRPEAFLRGIAQSSLGSHEGESEACRHGETFATLSSTIVYLDGRDPDRSFFLFAPGPPCRTEFERYALPEAS